MLQHKVCRRVDNNSPSNRWRVKACGTPYFAIDLDNEQHDRILELRRRGRSVYYCSPAFVERVALETHYRDGTVCTASVRVDVLPAAKLTDSKHHSVIFNHGGTAAFLCSPEPVRVKVVTREAFEHERGAREFSLEEARTLYDDLWTIATKRAFKGPEVQTPSADGLRETPPVRREFGTAADVAVEIAALASQYFGLSWLLVHDRASAGAEAPA